MIVLCIASCNERFELLNNCIISADVGNFDRKVIIINETPKDKLTESNRKVLETMKCEVYTRDWDENMPAMRNAYIDKVQNSDWIVVADDDEHFNEDFSRDIRTIIAHAENNNLDLLLINSHDLTFDLEGKGEELTSKFFKNLIFKKYSDTRYEGVGSEKKVHEQLIITETKPIRQSMLHTKYYYVHIKYIYEIWERALRNVFIGGGGNNVGATNEAWNELRQICDTLDIHTWHELRDYLKQGDVRTDLFQWIVNNRFKGFDWQNEMTDIFRYYFEYLHPEQNLEQWKVEEITNSRAKIMQHIEQLYLEVLGRHADTTGKTVYTRAVESGTLSLEQVRHKLLNSSEYKQKHPENLEKIPVEHIPINVDLHITDQVIIDHIIKKSKIFKDRFLDPLRLGLKWNALMAITKKEESEGRGTDHSAIENFIPFVDTFKKLANPQTHSFVLNVGAGAGAETKLLIDNGYSVVGITYGQDNMLEAKRNYNIDLLEMDMHNLKFPNNTFDAVFSIQTFEHAFSPWLHILEMRRVLRDGGLVFIDVPDPDDQAMLDTIWHTSVLYANQIKALFKKAGFKEKEDLSVKHRLAFCFEKLPDGEFEMWGYVRFIIKKLNVVF